MLLASELFQYSDFIIPNETEAELLTGCRVTTIDEARTAASALRAKGCNNVIITLGERGALFLGKDLLRAIREWISFPHEWIFFQTTESSHFFRITSLHSGKKCKSSYHIPIPSVSQDLVVDTTGNKAGYTATTCGRVARGGYATSPPQIPVSRPKSQS